VVVKTKDRTKLGGRGGAFASKQGGLSILLLKSLEGVGEYSFSMKKKKGGETGINRGNQSRKNKRGGFTRLLLPGKGDDRI